MTRRPWPVPKAATNYLALNQWTGVVHSIHPLRHRDGDLLTTCGVGREDSGLTLILPRYLSDGASGARPCKKCWYLIGRERP